MKDKKVMGKILQRYKHHGKAKTELKEVESISLPSSEFDIHATPIEEVVGTSNNNTDNVVKTEYAKPDEFKDHVNQLLSSSKTDAINKAKKALQSSEVDKPQSIKSDNKVNNNDTNKEHYEIEAEKLGFTDLPKNLANSLVAWRKSNRPVVTGHQWTERLGICRGCSHWMENKSTNTAKCMKCGCSSGKLLLASSNCPLSPPKWKSV